AVEAIQEPALAQRVNELAVEAGELAQTWWQKDVAARVELEELEGAIRTSAVELSQAVQKRQDQITALQEAAAAEIERVEQDLRTKTRLDEEQDLLRDQRELARQRFEEARTAREE